MGYKTITIVSKLEESLQAWTFDIKDADLIGLMEKYDGRGASILGDIQDIQDEIANTYK